MRFLADENFPGAAVSALTKAGHDVSWVRTFAPGASDAEVLALANTEGRVLLTFDKDFGERARAANLSAACGAVLFRIPMPPAGDSARDADFAAILERLGPPRRARYVRSEAAHSSFGLNDHSCEGGVTPAPGGSTS